ncbi:hypothetical protein GCM10023339_17560 [Alloalcanivorax gelatiniphagus]
MRRTTPFTTAALLGLALLAPATAVSAAGETCRGEAASLVGTGPTLTGTEGRDVIVTGTATSVSSLGGDDLVCVVPDGTDSNPLDVDTGAGNDVVDTLRASSSSYVDVVLGDGADAFVGGAGNDTVSAGPGSRVGLADDDADTVRTGGGNDRVTTGAVGGPWGSTANADVADLGPGDDRLTVVSWATTPEALLTGGEGDDTLVTDMSGTRNEVVVDLSAGRLAATHANPDVFAGDGRFSSFEAADVTIASHWLYYTGLPGDDSLTVHVGELGCCTLPSLEVTSLAGDDEVLVDNTVIDASSRIDTGDGEDSLVAARSNGFLDLDLKRATLATSDPEYPGTGGVSRGFPAVVGVENAFLMAPEVSMVGDADDNRLLFNGCDARITGGHGDDYLTHVAGDPWFEQYSFGCRASTTMSGGPGEDRLRGGPGLDKLRGDGGSDRLQGHRGTDVLLGGRGMDKADGGNGSDRCVAETSKRCER